jgi:hypothetical protein
MRITLGDSSGTLAFPFSTGTSAGSETLNPAGSQTSLPDQISGNLSNAFSFVTDPTTTGSGSRGGGSNSSTGAAGTSGTTVFLFLLGAVAVIALTRR